MLITDASVRRIVLAAQCAEALSRTSHSIGTWADHHPVLMSWGIPLSDQLCCSNDQFKTKQTTSGQFSEWVLGQRDKIPAS